MRRPSPGSAVVGVVVGAADGSALCDAVLSVGSADGSSDGFSPGSLLVRTVHEGAAPVTEAGVGSKRTQP